MSRHRQQDGAISIMAAVMAMAVLMATALAVDVGRVAYVSRDQQGVTDRAALDGVLALEDLPSDMTLTAAQPVVDAVIAGSLDRNPGSAGGGTAEDRIVQMVELGNVTGDEFLLPDCSMHVCTVADVSAVRVQTTSIVPFIFAVGATDDEDDSLNARRVTKGAVAESTELASISIGSTLAAVSGGLAEDALNGLVCGVAFNAGDTTCNLDISAVGWQGLATTDVALGELVEELELVAGAPDGLLSADVTALQFITAMANVLDARGETDQAQLLRGIALELPTDQLQLPTDDLDLLLGMIDLSTTSPGVAADARLNVLEMIKGSLEVANGDALLHIPGLTVAVPGVGTVDTTLKVIEAPRTAVGRAEKDASGNWTTSAETAQVRLGIDPVLTLDVIDGLEGVLSVLGDVTVSDVSLPMSLEVASARADLSEIMCAGTAPDAPDIRTLVNSDALRLRIGEVDPATGEMTPADVMAVRVKVGGLGLLGLGVATIDLELRAALDVPLGGATNEELTFLAADDANPSDDSSYSRGPKQVPGAAVDFGDVAASSLGLDVHVVNASLAGISLPLGPIVDPIVASIDDLVLSALLPLVASLEDALIQPLLSTFGVGVGNAAVWGNWANCDGRRLAPVR